MQTLATNLPGQPRMLDVLRAGLDAADEMALSVSFLRYSGLQLLIDDLHRFRERGGRARILTSTYLGITQPEALEALSQLDGVSVRLHVAQEKGASGFHPKFVVFRGTDTECWVGSSNLSKGGLTTNVEANLRQIDPTAIAQVSDTFEALWGGEHTFPLADELTDAYAQALLKALVDRKFISLRFDVPPAANTDDLAEPNAAQEEALSALALLREMGERKAVVIAAPGVGKTFLAAFDARAAGAASVLFVSHRLEHLTQAQDTFRRVFPRQFSTGLFYADAKESGADLVFTTVQSATGAPELLGRHFDYVVVDEFHHAAARSYRALLDQVNPDFLLGLTATPERQDGHDVLALCDFNIAYEVRLVEAINRQWLVPFHYFGIADETVDYNESFWRKPKFDAEKMENALMLEERVELVLQHAIEKGYDGVRRATVGFCAGRRHAHFMADALRRKGLDAVALTGEDNLARRKEVYDALEDPTNPLEWLFVADLLNEGVDIPGINSLLFLRPTDSATVFIQQLGRGLRLSPQCEVLTALDFVGHHRNAWMAIEALSDHGATIGQRTVDGSITPPKNCEIILDEKTRDILAKVKRFTGKKKDRCIESYQRLREELGTPPFPVDLLGRTDVPTLSEFRTAFGSWLDVRRELGDSHAWEDSLHAGSPAYELLAAAERDWQQPRVYAYALFWGLCHSPTAPDLGYRAFFDRFPRWTAEHANISDTKVWGSLEKKLGPLVAEHLLVDEILEAIPHDELLRQVEARLRYTLDGDFKTRHGGVLRRPEDLDVHRAYARPEIINHFGQQYDPARHNMGVMRFGDHVVMITKIDTSSAKDEFQYENRFSAPSTFHWQSQNKQRQDNASGRLILDHQQTGTQLHLFVQARSHKLPVYAGLANVEAVSGNAPMNVTFWLRREMPDGLLASLGAS